MIPPMWIILKLFRVTPDGPPAILIGQENRRQTVGNVASDVAKLDLRGTLDAERVPASYRTLIIRGVVHFVDCGWNSAGC